jgi:predicted GIY-YIG superfamily endonuclease
LRSARLPTTATFEKPLCYAHWQQWDRRELIECSRCHWFMASNIEEASRWKDWSHCLQDFTCDPRLPSALHDALPQFRHQRVKLPSLDEYGQIPPILARASIARTLRHVYVLKLEGGHLYVGQTTNLPVRMVEHRDGAVPSTKGKNPKLAYYEAYEGDKDRVITREVELTRMNQSPSGRRQLRQMIEDFRAPLRLVDLDA